MAEKIKEDKIILEREYIVPLRKKFINTPQYKRTPKAVKALKEFIAKHMKVEARDVNKVKLDNYLNLEMWHRSIRKPLAKIKVKAKKFDSGIVTVELVDIPTVLQFKMDRAKKLNQGFKDKVLDSHRESKDSRDSTTPIRDEKTPISEKKEETTEEKKDKEEKKESVKEAGFAASELAHKETKHLKTKEKPQVHRMALQK